MRTASGTSGLFVATFPSNQAFYSHINEVWVERADGTEESYSVFKSGRSVISDQLKVELRKSDKKQPADFWANIYNLPIINAKVRAVFDQQDVGNAEYLPVTICGKALPKQEYFLANIMDKHDVVDWSKTQCERQPPDDPTGTITYMHSLVLDAARIPMVNLFYMQEPRRVVMKAPLANAIKEAELTGVQLDDIEQFDFQT